MSVGGYGSQSAQRLVHLKIDQNTENGKWVPFDGGSEAVTNLLGGHIDATVTNAGQVSQLAKAGKVRVLAVARTVRGSASRRADVRRRGAPDVTRRTGGASTSRAAHRRPWWTSS